MSLIAVLGLVLTAAIGIWGWFKRRFSEQRKIAEEARKQYEEAVKSGDVSAITAALSRINKLQ